MDLSSAELVLLVCEDLHPTLHHPWLHSDAKIAAGLQTRIK